MALKPPSYEEWMAEIAAIKNPPRPDRSFTVTELARALGRGAGFVSERLREFDEQGLLERTTINEPNVSGRMSSKVVFRLKRKGGADDRPARKRRNAV